MSNITRRQFVKRSVAVGAASVAFPRLIRAQGLNEKLQVGFIAVGGRAGAHTGAAHGETASKTRIYHPEQSGL